MKKILNIFAVIAIVAFAAVAASAQGPKSSETVVFSVVPQMTCQNCENKIKSNLRFEKGVSSIETNLQNQTVTITFDPAKTDKAKLAAAFKKIGYEAAEGASCKKAEGCGKAAHKGCCGKKEGCAEKKAGCKKSEGCGKAESNGCCGK